MHTKFSNNEYEAWVQSLNLNVIPAEVVEQNTSIEIDGPTNEINLDESLGSVICDGIKTKVSQHFEALKEKFLAVERENILLTQKLADKEDKVKDLKEQVCKLTEKAKMHTCNECEEVIDQPMFCNSDCLK